MKIMDIFTKPLATHEQWKFVVFCLMTVLWLLMIIGITITAIKTDSTKAMLAMPGILTIQLLVTYSYTDCRIASVKKELLKEQEEIKFALKVHELSKEGRNHSSDRENS